jgi:hypothetical protein
MSNRNPYPYPQLENDDNFVKKSPNKNLSPSKSSEEALKLSQGEIDPWTRLNYTQTLTSGRRHIDHYDPQTPNDKLDFVLKCQYNHSQQFLKSEAETLVQPETLDLPHGRVLKNRPIISKPLTLEDKDLVSFSEPRKTTVNSAKGLAIDGHHSEATNRGFSRKKDGGFFTT